MAMVIPANISPEDVAYYQNLRRKHVIHYVWMTVIYLFLTIWAVLALFPIVWVLINSFKPSLEVQTNPLGLVLSQWSFQNYITCFSFGDSFNVPLAYWNSIYTSVIIVVLCLATSVMMAFCLARFKFPGHRFLEIAVIACMMFPVFSLVSPLYRLYVQIKFWDTHIGVVLPLVALNMGFTTTLLIGFFRSLPLEVEESAFLDGASVPRTLIQIVLPMMRSALVTCVIFIFLWSYNDLFVQNFVIRQGQNRLLPYLMVTVTQKKGTDYGQMCAVGALVAIPMLIVYFFLQKHIIKGLTAGAVKG